MSEIIKRKFMINRLNFLLYVRLQHHDKNILKQQRKEINENLQMTQMAF